MKERIVSVAIKRNGKVCDVDASRHSHRELRQSLGDVDPDFSKWDDVDGFLTNTGRFLNRREAVDVALASGQIRRPKAHLLSSDILQW